MKYHKNTLEINTMDKLPTSIPEGTLVLTRAEEVAAYLGERKVPVLGIMEKEDAFFHGAKYVCQAEFLASDEAAEYLEQVYRRCKALPWDILETKRLFVRETTEEDVPAFYELYKEPAITRYTEGLLEDPAAELAYTRQYREQVYELYGFGIWTVLEKESGKIIGRAGITMREGFEEPEIGFVIGLPFQGKGYGIEVCSAIKAYAKDVLGFEKLQAFVLDENEASVKLLRKLGMEKKEKQVIGHVPHTRYACEL